MTFSRLKALARKPEKTKLVQAHIPASLHKDISKMLREAKISWRHLIIEGLAEFRDMYKEKK